MRMLVPALLLSVAVVGCAQMGTQTSNPKSPDPIVSPADDPAQEPRKFLEEAYIKALMAGGTGYELWCPTILQGSPTSLYAVRSYKIVKEKAGIENNGEGDKWGRFTLLVESSTKGGTPISKNWVIIVSEAAPKSSKFCVKALRDGDEFPDES